MLEFYYDKYGLITLQNGDAGDCSNSEGLFFFHNYFEAYQLDHTFDDVLTMLQVEPGIFIRNPTQNPVIPPAKSWNDPTDFSRDQTVPLIIAMGALKKYKVLKTTLWNQIKRFGFYQNHDLPDPQTIGYYIRGFSISWLWPILLFTDIGLLINSIIRVIAGRDYNNVGPDLNHTIGLLQAQYFLPTPVSYLARKFYKRFRPYGIFYPWVWYFRPQTGNNPFDKLYKDLIMKM